MKSRKALLKSENFSKAFRNSERAEIFQMSLNNQRVLNDQQGVSFKE